MGKKQSDETSVAVITKERYPILQAEGAKTVQLIIESLGGAEISPFDLERIKIPSGGSEFWVVLDENGDEETVKELEGILVHMSRQRAWWKDSGNASEATPPDCISLDSIIGKGDLTGSGEETENVCSTCPLAQFGSKAGSKGQDCKAQTILFLVRPGQFLPSILPLPPTSIQPAKKFFLSQASRGLATSQYEVSLSLEKKTGPHGPYSVCKIKKKENLDRENTDSVIFAYCKALESVFTKVSPAIETDNSGE